MPIATWDFGPRASKMTEHKTKTANFVFKKDDTPIPVAVIANPAITIFLAMSKALLPCTSRKSGTLTAP